MPTFGKTTFGSPVTIADSDSMSLRGDSPYATEPPASLGRSTGSLPRPPLPKSSLSYSASAHDLTGLEPPSMPPRIGKLSNGSASSLGTHVLQASGSGNGLLGARKSSFASLKNVFKSGERGTPPPVPSWDSKPGSGAGYPALKNPFSPVPASPPSATGRPRANTKSSMSSAFHNFSERNRSVATLHSSQRSLGARSTRSDASSNFRAEDYPLPAIPRIPNRSTPSRAGRQGSDTSMFSAMPPRPSMSGDDMMETFGRTPAEEALRVVFQNFREVAEKKIQKVLAKPLVSYCVTVLMEDYTSVHHFLSGVWRRRSVRRASRIVGELCA